VRQHTVIGQRILAAAPGMAEVGGIVRATHERWDGSGYVDGLEAGMIPRAARIIAVCDAYAAMTTDRPYRQAMAPQDALAELRRCAGSQFDPEVVLVFCRLHGSVTVSTGAPAEAGLTR
jgi:HD-GYP domain-containing protein (c-di-GMP phosphodiesterase class II)